MKTFSGVLALTAALWLFAPHGVRPGEEAVSPRSITVTGEAEVRVVPDEVLLTLGVQTWDRDLEQAKAQNDRILRQVLTLAEAHEIERRHVQTDHMSVEPRYEDSYEARDFVGFFVRKTIVVRLQDLDKFEDFYTEVLESGVNYVHGVAFRTNALRAHRDQARALAIKAAREKAEALAGTLDQGIGEPLEIQEEHTGWWSWYGAGWWGPHGGGTWQNVVQNAGGEASLGEGAIAPGQISVTARISATFALDG